MENNYKANKGILLLQTFSLGVLFAGAIGTLLLTLESRRSNESILLVSIICLWVLSPFVGMLIFTIGFKRLIFSYQLSMSILMLAVSLISLACYSGLIIIPQLQYALIFLVAPLICWVIIFAVFFLNLIWKD